MQKKFLKVLDFFKTWIYNLIMTTAQIKERGLKL